MQLFAHLSVQMAGLVRRQTHVVVHRAGLEALVSLVSNLRPI